ncbi:MAG: endonuclease/exonuclease/phosphatase family protein [Desulfococcaceae bacterium]|jgi:endonuclease/exonuclease/phosphatase family metal-dependent hydrolase|nr:endonuclease/exonuclease/phosphatase family protein [Desulfococcaceae bacterium]
MNLMNLMNHIINLYRGFLKILSRNEWFARMLELPRCEGSGSEPGLVMIQIDGLSHTQFQRALSRKKLPFIRKLLSRQRFTQKPFYSGMPSATPGVQAELFYGVKTAVPAFEFMDRKSGTRHAMFYPASANAVARQLQQQGRALLQGGSSYSNIFSGGAQTARYCAESMNLQSLLKSVNPLKLIFILLFHTGKLFRIIAFALLELLLAVYDFFNGVFGGKDILKELKFIPTRLFVCVILREMVRFRVKTDLARGVPIISANFFAYDEQAHRRGPESAFAHWTLKGIDETLKDICRTAMRSECRDYRLLIYSDHGQEPVKSYSKFFDRSVRQTVRELYDKYNHSHHRKNRENNDHSPEDIYRRAANLLFGKQFISGPRREELSDLHTHQTDQIEITTMGPLGHIYLPSTFFSRTESSGTPDREETSGSHSDRLEAFADILHKEAGIPLVLFNKNGKIQAINDSGSFELQKNREGILGKSHPFVKETAADLENLCFHPNAGDIVISGWTPGGPPLSFNTENGAHGGPGTEETRGFVILPPCIGSHHSYLRPLDLRNLIFRYMEKKESLIPRPLIKKNRKDRSLSILTYNIHSCIHTDGKSNPDRTADIIAALNPDIAALQEVDSGRRRSRFTAQGNYLAARLGMKCRFFPVIQKEHQQYGLALLSRFPFHSLKYSLYPREIQYRQREPRGLLLADIETPAGMIRMANTHLGLTVKERRVQVAALLADNWISASLKKNTPLLVFGDFNAGPRSYVYRKMTAHVRDVQMQVPHQKAKPTFYSHYPLLRLDHIFISDHFRTEKVLVPDDKETRRVSDHLPLYCELFFK